MSNPVENQSTTEQVVGALQAAPPPPAPPPVAPTVVPQAAPSVAPTAVSQAAPQAEVLSLEVLKAQAMHAADAAKMIEKQVVSAAENAATFFRQHPVETGMAVGVAVVAVAAITRSLHK